MFKEFANLWEFPSICLCLCVFWFFEYINICLVCIRKFFLLRVSILSFKCYSFRARTTGLLRNIAIDFDAMLLAPQRFLSFLGISAINKVILSYHFFMILYDTIILRFVRFCVIYQTK